MSRALATLLAVTLAVPAAAGGGAGCGYRVERRLRAADTLKASGGAARFHLRDGQMLAFTSWALEAGVVRGEGTRYDVHRAAVQHGVVSAPLADVLVVETSERKTLGATSLGVFTVLTVIGAVACASNPKACFGSCPTFYVPAAGAQGGWALQAEGFSRSVARSLEADDLDDLPAARAVDGVVTVAVRNEAYETHFLRRVELVVVDAPAGAGAAAAGAAAAGAEIVQLAGAGASFVATAAPRGPERCAGGAADCATLAASDGDELVGVADATDLGARTATELGFAAPGAATVAVVLSARNTLMTTFIFYHLLALLGREMGAWLAAVERREPRVLAAMVRWGWALDGVTVSVRQGGPATPWRRVGRLEYIGPIATQTRGVVASGLDPAAPLEVRLDHALADWRLDAVRVAKVIAQEVRVTVVPATVGPAGVVSGGHEARAAEVSLGGRGERVMMVPGDELRLTFAVPSPLSPVGARGYFLATRGYYYEWMRDSWLKDEDPALAWAYFTDPPRALRELAPAYKAVEADMDAIFEASRFRRPEGARAP